MESARSVTRSAIVYGRLQRRMVERSPSCRFWLPSPLGRPYGLMCWACRYDVSGVPPGKIEDIIKFDWKDLVFNKRIFDSPSYLREKGKPVVALWGTVILLPPYSVTANTDRDFSILARLWVRRLSPYARSRSLNRFLHK